MDNLKLKNSILTGALALALAACSGGDGGSPAVTTTSGKVIAGPVQGAQVYLDVNDNRTIDAGDTTCATCLTDATGAFNFPGIPNPNTHVFITKGGVDSYTGVAMTGTLMAPPGATAVTPLTSLVVANLPAGSVNAGAVATANDAVVASLGLPAGTTLATTDTTAPGNEAILAKESAVQSILNQVTNAAGAATSGNKDAIFAAALESLAASLKTAAANNAPVDLAAGGAALTTMVNSMVSAAVTSTGSTTVSGASLAALVSGSIVASAQHVAAATTPAAIQAAADTADNGDTVMANTITTLAVVLTPANETAMTTSLTSLGTAITSAVSAGGVTATSLALAIDTAASTDASLLAAGVNAADLASLANLQGVFIVGGVTVNGTTGANNVITIPAASHASGLTTAAITATPSTVKPAAGTSTVDLGFSVTPVSTTDARRIQVVITGVLATVDTNGAVTVNIPAAATLYAYGRKTDGTSVNVTATSLSANLVTATPSGASTVLTLNIANIMSVLISKSATFSTLANVSGGFNVDVAIAGVKLADDPTTPSPAFSIAVTGSTNVLGQGGNLTVNLQ